MGHSKLSEARNKILAKRKKQNKTTKNLYFLKSKFPKYFYRNRKLPRDVLGRWCMWSQVRVNVTLE